MRSGRLVFVLCEMPFEGLERLVADVMLHAAGVLGGGLRVHAEPGEHLRETHVPLKDILRALAALVRDDVFVLAGLLEMAAFHHLWHRDAHIEIAQAVILKAKLIDLLQAQRIECLRRPAATGSPDIWFRGTFPRIPA